MIMEHIEEQEPTKCLHREVPNREIPKRRSRRIGTRIFRFRHIEEQRTDEVLASQFPESRKAVALERLGTWSPVVVT
jgi:hypothetical protein